MPETTPAPPPPSGDAILIKKVAEALIENIPVAGKLINALVFEKDKALADAAGKQLLAEQLQRIEESQQTQNTDLGDVLLKIGTLEELTQGLQNATLLLARFVQGTAAPEQIATVRAAMQVVPELLPLLPDASKVPVERDTLETAIRGQLSNIQLNALVGSLANASENVSEDATKLTKVTQLLDFAPTADGPGLAGLLAVIQKRHPGFRYPM